MILFYIFHFIETAMCLSTSNLKTSNLSYLRGENKSYKQNKYLLCNTKIHIFMYLSLSMENKSSRDLLIKYTSM